MKYMLLIYDDEHRWAGMSPEESGQIMQEYFQYSDWVQGQGIFVAGDALQPTSAARTVKVRDGERVVTDGPFAETKEQLGGYYLVECDTIEQALEAAARVPSSRIGSIEVRPLMDIPAPQG